MVFGIVIKVIKTNQNISIGSKKVDWVCSFCFGSEPVHHFVSGPNRCIKCNRGMVFSTVTEVTKTNQNITIGSKTVDLVRYFHFWPEQEHLFVFRFESLHLMQPRHGFRHSNETKENEPKHHYWVQKVEWVRSFRFWTEPVHHFISGLNRCVKCNPIMVFGRVTKLTKRTKSSLLGQKN